jgi:hypothetical protein
MIDKIKNDKLRDLADKAQHRSTGDFGMTIVGGVDLEKFAESIIDDIAKTLQAEWYRLNNQKDQTTETTRDVAIRVGQQMALIYAINKIRGQYQ